MTKPLLAALLAATALSATPLAAQEMHGTAPSLEDGFQSPPSSARPRVWWHWMNGNVTKDGIDKDFDWMARIGIGGVQNFDANLATPQIVEKRLVYMDDGWKDAFRHAVTQADKKGLEFAIAASPGWSETGGPWVKPADAMKKLVWSETVVPGGKRFAGKLPAAPDVTGPFQNVRMYDFMASATGTAPVNPPKASGAVTVLAVPAVAGLATPRVTTTAGAALDAALLADADPESTLDVPVGSTDAPDGMVFDFGTAVTVRALTFFTPHAKPPFIGPAFKPVLEAEGTSGWTKLGDLPLGEAATTISFAPVTAQRFRILMTPNSGNIPSGLGGGAPGAETIDVFSRPKPSSIKVGHVAFSADARVSLGEVKAGYDMTNNYLDIADHGTTPGINLAQVIDLTSRVKPDGTLDWKAPKGSAWRIYRFGWSLTGKTNHPATPEATGLEVDKYDAGAVRRYIETYLGMYRDVVGKDMIGKRGIRALLTDSIEVGPSNWTPDMFAQFKARRGYDLLPWLPALAGEVIGTAAETEKFLSDYRATLADLVADAHYGTIAKVARENGMIVYGEAHENGRPVLGDDLAMRSHADVPMSALWTWGAGETPRATLIGDMKGASSVAHVLGQNLVAAESMTSANAPWAYAPKDLKKFIDLEFALGVNRPVIHTSVHQPVDDKKPGLSLMIFGQYFNRHDAWAEMAKPWVDYMARSSFLLQQGRNHADIAYFYGEESPVTGLFEFDMPKGLPKTYAYDFVNAAMLRDTLSVQGNEIVAKGGARYKAIYLGGRSHSMTLATLQRLATMVEAGASLIGKKSASSPALKDDPVAFKALADRLWKSPRVVDSDDVESGMAKLGVTPDFQYTVSHPSMGDAEVLFVHRKLADGDAYWINNRSNKPVHINAKFGVFGRNAELWDAVTGARTPLAVFPNMDGKTTTAMLMLQPEDAKFIVFRGGTIARVEGASLVLSKEARIGTDGAKNPILFPAPPARLMMTGPWTVSFQPGRGAPSSVSMKTLSPLNENANMGIRYFSGIATYKTSFTPPKVKAGQNLLLDLGEVGDLAEVRVNGQSVGTAWLAPYRIDIGKMVKPGANTLEVRVANTWVNRLIGDKQPGAQKVTFTAAPTYKADAPLRRSGLIGPVTLDVAD